MVSTTAAAPVTSKSPITTLALKRSLKRHLSPAQQLTVRLTRALRKLKPPPFQYHSPLLHGEFNLADAFDVRHARVELVVDHDAPARINFDTNFFEAEAFDVWSATDGNKDNIGLDL